MAEIIPANPLGVERGAMEVRPFQSAQPDPDSETRKATRAAGTEKRKAEQAERRNVMLAKLDAEMRDSESREWHVMTALRFLMEHAHQLSTDALCVFLGLEVHARGKPYCYPTNDRLASLFGVALHVIKGAVAELEEKGFVRRVMSSGGRERIGFLMLIRMSGDVPALDPSREAETVKALHAEYAEFLVSRGHASNHPKGEVVRNRGGEVVGPPTTGGGQTSDHKKRPNIQKDEVKERPPGLPISPTEKKGGREGYIFAPQGEEDRIRPDVDRAVRQVRTLYRGDDTITQQALALCEAWPPPWVADAFMVAHERHAGKAAEYARIVLARYEEQGGSDAELRSGRERAAAQRSAERQAAEQEKQRIAQ